MSAITKESQFGRYQGNGQSPEQHLRKSWKTKTSTSKGILVLLSF
jgi:hypothetical protein